MKSFLSKIKPIGINILRYVILTIIVIGSFLLGGFVEKNSVEISNVIKVDKDDVNIAIDEGNNLIIIDNKSGNYIIYQDLIGQSIFKLYTKNIWIDKKQNE